MVRHVAGRAGPGLVLLVVHLGLSYLADSLLLVQLLHNDLASIGLGQPLRVVAFAALAAAAQYPSRPPQADSDSPVGTASHGERLLLLGLVILVPPLIQLWQSLAGDPVRALSIAVACVFLSTLVIIRMTFLMREQHAIAITDALTGLHTRRFFDGALTGVSGRPEDVRLDTGLILIDVDHFKKVNDTYGHVAGDLVLQEIGRRLRAGVRREDVLARYGGEEFAVLVANVDSETIRAVAERLRVNVAEEPVLLADGTTLRVTVSIGLASVGEGNDSVDQLKLSADQRLYAAKANGRNQIVGASARS